MNAKVPVFFFGMPETRPVFALSLTPVGVFPRRFHFTGATPPACASCTEQAWPIVAAGSVFVVMRKHVSVVTATV